MRKLPRKALSKSERHLPTDFDRLLLETCLIRVAQDGKGRWVSTFSSGSELLAALGSSRRWNTESFDRVYNGLHRLKAVNLIFVGRWIEPGKRGKPAKEYEGVKELSVIKPRRTRRSADK